MTEAQALAALGVLAAAFFGMMTIVSTLFTRVLRTEIGGVSAHIDSLGERLDSLHSEMTAQFDAVNTRIDSLDRDIQGIISREPGRG